jgi:hypothetical protein
MYVCLCVPGVGHSFGASVSLSLCVSLCACAVDRQVASRAGSLGDADADVEVLGDSARVSLACPIALTRIQTPVRGDACTHAQVRAVQEQV